MLSLLSGERTDLLPVDRFCQVVQYRSLSGNIHFHIFIEYIKFRHIPDNAVQHRFFVSYQCIIFAEHPIRLKPERYSVSLSVSLTGTNCPYLLRSDLYFHPM